MIIGKERDISALCYINEQVSDPNDYQGRWNYDIGGDSHNPFVTFSGILQSFGVINRNKRMYEAANVMEQINRSEFIQDQLARNHWMGEEDHPNSELDGQRLSVARIKVPSMRYSSHYIRSPRLVGSLLEANIQTDNGTRAGQNMTTKIIDGKIIPAFSARAFGELRNKNGKPTVHVNQLITYDWVAFPSHRDALAKIKQPICESAAVDGLENILGSRIVFLSEMAQRVANNSAEAELLCESFDLGIEDVIGITANGEHLLIKEDANLYAQKITNGNELKKRTKNDIKMWLDN